MAVSITIASLNATPQTREASLTTSWCAERLTGVYEALSSEMAIAVTATRHADVVEAHTRVQGKFACACSRCAEPVDLAVDTEFDHHFVGPGQLDAGDEVDVESLDDDPDVSEHDGTSIELDELCIEHVILALPDVPLCDEECKGLCPRCAINRNHESCTCDLREDRASPWTKLAELRVVKD